MKYPFNKAVANKEHLQHVYFNISWDWLDISIHLNHDQVRFYQEVSSLGVFLSLHCDSVGQPRASNLRICHHCNFCPSRIGCPMPRTTDAHATRSENGLWCVYFKPCKALQTHHKITPKHKITRNGCWTNHCRKSALKHGLDYQMRWFFSEFVFFCWFQISGNVGFFSIFTSTVCFWPSTTSTGPIDLLPQKKLNCHIPWRA